MVQLTTEQRIFAVKLRIENHIMEEIKTFILFLFCILK